MNLLDIFNDGAFSMTALTAAVNNRDHVPQRAGELCFAGVGVGVPTTSIAIETRDQALAIVPTSPRGGPSPQETRDRSKLFDLDIPQVKLEETIGAHVLQNARQFGVIPLQTGLNLITEQVDKMLGRHDLTLESFRLGAIKGIIRDADGTVIRNVFTDFGVDQPDDIVFTTAAGSLRNACQNVSRSQIRNAKLPIPTSTKPWCFCGKDFFESVINHVDVAGAYNGWFAAEQKLAGGYAFGVFEFAGIFFEEYHGTDGVTGEESSDGELYGEVGIATDEGRFFLTGVPGLYREHFAPADFLDTANGIGLPRYSRIAVDPEMSRWVKVHVQQNPLPVCLRPRTLIRGHF